MKILLVDDEIRFRSTMAKRLKARGNDVETAGSGEEAIEAVQTNDYDVVVMDVRMPGIGGIEATAAIKKIKPDVEIILLTGHACLAVNKELIDSKVYDCLLKPCDLNTLMEKLQLAYERRQLRRNS